MTVSTSTSSVVYRGNGAATQFAVPFKVLDEDHLVVTRRDYATGELLYTYIGTDYTYSGIGDDAGTLTLAGTALDDDYELVIERIVPYTQDLDIVNAGGFYPETVEEQLDLITMGIQQVADLAGRGMVVPVGEDGLELPKALDRAGKFPVFDATGRVVMSSGTGNDAALRTDMAAEGGVDLVNAQDLEPYPISGRFKSPEVSLLGFINSDDTRTAMMSGDTTTAGALALPNVSTEFATALAAAKAYRRPLILPQRLRCTSNVRLDMSTGGASVFNRATDIRGFGPMASVIWWDGTAIDKGLHIDGVSNYAHCGTISGVGFQCYNGAKRGMTANWTNHLRLVDCWFLDAAEHAFFAEDTIFTQLHSTRIFSSGDATHAQARLCGLSTHFIMRDSRIAGGNAGCVAGLDIDGMSNYTVEANNIESTGICMRIGKAAHATRGCFAGRVLGNGFENSGASVIEVGEGLSGSAWVDNLSLRGNKESLSSSTTTVRFLKAWRSRSLLAEQNEMSLIDPGGDAFFVFMGTDNSNAIIRAHPRMFGLPQAWVTVNGVQRIDAGPRADWSMSGWSTVRARKNITLTATTAATLDPYDGSTLAVPYGQGGIDEILYLTCSGGATDINGIMVGVDGSEVSIVPLDTNATFKHLTGSVPRFRNRSGADVVGAIGVMKRWKYNSSTGDYHELF